ncbi:MAG: hypothetical protein IIU76_02625, partial [Bacteroidales bacterium]|nr:hypothetical protein [Bacteroidales bacterium]
MKKIQSTLPGLSREAEEKKLEEILAIAQTNLKKAKEGIEQMGQDVAELYATMDHRDKGSLILWNDASLQKRFGVIEGITDRNYLTNSYHVFVQEEINAFDKLKF